MTERGEHERAGAGRGGAAQPSAHDLSPVLVPDPLDLRVSVAAVVHWADSLQVRRRFMREVGFPLDDVPAFLVVNQLTYRGAMRPSDLAAAIGTGRANLTKIAQRLEGAGLVVRAADGRDARSTLLALSPAGRAIGEQVVVVSAQHVQEKLVDWSAEEVDVLRRVMARFARPALAELARSEQARTGPPPRG